MPPELPDATVRYAGHPDAVVDLHLPGGSRPAGPDVPLVVVLHGGFWKQEWDRRHTRPMARVLADLGAVVATPEYRRVRGGGGWPVTGEDVLTAVRRLPGLLDGLGIATGPVTVTGHSAGGQLALWLTSRGSEATGLVPERTVALAPVCDLREAIRLGLGDGATRALLEAGSEDAPGTVDDALVDSADPMVLLDVRPEGEVLVVHGTEDDVVPVQLSRRLVDRHPWIDLREVPAGHMDLVEPASPAWPAVLDALGLPEPG